MFTIFCLTCIPSKDRFLDIWNFFSSIWCDTL